MEVATGSIRKFCGITGRSLTTVRSVTLTPTACSCPSMMGCVAGAISLTSSSTTSATPVPNTALLMRHSPTCLRICVFSKSSCSFCRKYTTSCVSASPISSVMSKYLPRPKVASSISATLDSTACCNAGEMIRERSLLRSMSSAAQIPRHRR